MCTLTAFGTVSISMGLPDGILNLSPVCEAFVEKRGIAFQMYSELFFSVELKLLRVALQPS